MKFASLSRFVSLLALAIAPLTPVYAQAQTQSASLESAFDSAFGTEVRAPRDYAPPLDTAFERRIAQLAEGSQGRIGVAAIDLSTGQQISVYGDQRFPLASTSKIAIAAAYLEGVDQGRWSLTSEYPLLWAVRSEPLSSRAAPVRRGEYLPAIELIDLMITRSSNPATDALIAAMGGVEPVNDWMRRAGITEFSLDRDIATLVRDNREFDARSYIDPRDSASPEAMVQLLAGIYQGRWLSRESRAIIVDAMERCRTGRNRIPALMPSGVTVAHKTGTLHRVASDIGILTGPDGRSIAVAIYVTGQNTPQARDARIASIARAIYDGYADEAARDFARSNYGNAAAR
ncbi:serine hydrolase [Erythrobacter alti]|uniref:serine hydrolase n=1 Tax=Erythrobacter alti TaxID=1896145 RepID=UPI0030F41AC3